MSKAIVYGGTAVFESKDVGGLGEFIGNLEIKLPGNAKLKSGEGPAFTEDMVPNVKLPVTYKAKGFEDVPGTGELTIMALNADQKSTKLKLEGNIVVIVGSQFDALFTVKSPSQKILPNGAAMPSPAPSYSVKGTFKTSNSKKTAA